MTKKIVTLLPSKKPEPPAFNEITNQQTIDLLEKLLAEAKEGNIISTAVMFQDKEGTYDACWSGYESVTALLGSFELLKIKIINNV